MTDRAKKLINWSELSRLIGHRSLIGAKDIPDKYQPDIDKLLLMVDRWALNFANKWEERKQEEAELQKWREDQKNSTKV